MNPYEFLDQCYVGDLVQLDGHNAWVLEVIEYSIKKSSPIQILHDVHGLMMLMVDEDDSYLYLFKSLSSKSAPINRIVDDYKVLSKFYDCHGIIAS